MATMLEAQAKSAWKASAFQGFTGCCHCGTLTYCCGVNPGSRVCLDCFDLVFNGRAPNLRRTPGARREAQKGVLVRAQGQMTLEVGGEDLDDLRTTGSYSIGGRINATAELPKGADVRVTVTDMDGEIVATGLGRVGTLAFKQHEKDEVRWTERQHKVRVS